MASEFITILQLAEYYWCNDPNFGPEWLWAKEREYTAKDFYDVGLDILGGCVVCGAALGPAQAHPSRSGYWKCKDCIGVDGYTTVFEAAEDLERQYKEYLTEIEEHHNG